MQMCPQEVGAFAWIDRQVAAAIVDSSEEHAHRDEAMHQALPPTIRYNRVTALSIVFFSILMFSSQAFMNECKIWH